MDMQALIDEMGALIAKIKSGEATLGEIEAFAAAAAQLHERAVVLRYKSYEAKVYGTPVEPVQEFNAPMAGTAGATLLDPPSREEAETSPFEGGMRGMTETNETLEVEETASLVDISSQEEEPKAIYSEPDAVSNPVRTESATEEQAFDLFADEPEEETFDLFSLDNDEPEEASAAAEEVAMAAEIIEETEPVVKAEQAAEPAQISQSPQEDPVMEETPIAEEAVTTPQSTWVEPVLTEESVTTIDELAAEEEPQAEVISQQTEVPTAAVNVAPAASEHPVYNRLVTDDNSLAARLMAIRLETLKGAFGFNERLQIIRELFDGSNDAFNQAIDTLDELDSKNEARKVVSGYANKFAWDKDSDLALEFVQKVERRYA